MIDLRRYALGVCVVMLAGCGGHASNGVVPSGAPNSSLPHHKSLYYTGGAQTFDVPTGVTQISVVARGAKGAGKPIADGGRVHAVIPVTPGETLVVYVGGDASESTGGFNGGGSGGYGDSNGYGGGGASDVREGGDGLANRILVAGGGGGQGGGNYYKPFGAGGQGGGKTGGAGAKGGFSPYGSGNGSHYSGGGGGGGTQDNGGAGGSEGTGPTCYGVPGDDGSFGQGGAGANGASRECGGSGGGGGGGYYGGGGGGAGAAYYSGYYGGGGGGGGGSSYAESRAKDVHIWQGWKNRAHNGLVVFSW
ncbi:MAG: hypothetical protein WAK11_12410 [Candidatus Cybelea sp.]